MRENKPFISFVDVVIGHAVCFIIFGFEVGGSNSNFWRVFLAGFGEVLYGLLNGKAGVMNIIDN